MAWLSERGEIIPLVFALCSGIVCLLALRRLLKGSTVPGGIRVPPGTLGLPFVGETIHLLRTQKKGAPHEFYDTRMQRYGHNLFTTHLLGHPTVVLCSPEGNHFLFSNENKLVLNSWPSSVAALFKYSLINTVGEDWRRLKRMLMCFLRAEALQKFIGRMDSITIHHLREHWSGKDQVSVYPLMKHYTFSLACDFFASLNDDDAKAKLSANFIILLKGVMSIPIDLPGSQYYKAKVAANAIRQQLAEIIEQRRIALRNASACPEQDLLSLMLCSVDEEGGKALTDDEIKANIILLLFAGHDTTSCVLTSLFKFLAENPHCYEQVMREQLEIAVSKKQGQLLEWDDLQKMKYSWRVAQETLRLQPPIQGAYRRAIKDFTYCGFSIPKGWKLHWTVNSTHHKSEYFSNPEKFDPTRFEGMGPAPYTFVPFGGGQRMCPGNEFARVEILILLHNVVKNYRWTLVDPEEEVSIDPMPVPRKGLPVKLFPCPRS